MKKIEIRTLSLRNFKGFTFALSGRGDFDVYGDNATGKTTLADAFSWLLFDKDSLGKSDFEIKSLDSQGEYLHNLEHEVEGVFIIDGAQVSLKKVYKEVWTKKRGAAKQENTGNTTEHYIDAVPVQKQLYVSKIKELFGDEDVFRLLTTPTAFPALHWTKQRALLMEICGDITDAQVIASDPSLAPLTEILGQRTLDDHKKVVTSRRSEINKELDRIPVRIDEQKRMMPDVTGLNLAELNAARLAIEDFIGECQLKLQGIDNGAGIAELSKELQGLKYDIGQLENKYYLEGMQHVVQMNARINELTSGRQDKTTQIHNVRFGIEQNQKRIAGLEAQLQGLRDKWTAIDAETFQDTTEDTCPACGQALPPERVQEARDKALAQFNQSKAERLLAVEMRGKELRGELDNTTPIIERLHAQLLELQEAVSDDDQFDALVAERDILKALAEDFSQIPGRVEMLEKKAEIEKQIEAARNGVSQDKDGIQKEIEGLKVQLAEVKEKIDRFTRREQEMKRIEELKADEKRLTAEFEKLEQELYLIESFIKAKVSMLTEKINGLFQIVRFKLYDVQVNQGLAECCVATVAGVPYDSGLNSAARIQAGLDIIRTLQRHYGLNCPIWIDNRESCTLIPQMSCQVISLIVSPEDKALRVETAKKRIAA